LVPAYLDECLDDPAVVRALRRAGHVVYTTTELHLKGQSDAMQLQTAIGLAAVLISQNDRDFTRLHRNYEAQGIAHSGILVTPQIRDVGERVTRVERALRLLTSEVAADQLMRLDLFDTEERGLLYVASLGSTSS
jgi:hypothetical protein